MAYNVKKKRSIKEQITQGLFHHVKNNNARVFKCFLCLPSTKAKDVEEALKRGVIDHNTKIIAIEHNTDHLPKVKSSLTKLGFKHKSRVVLNMDICDITSQVLKAACKKLGVEGIDLFYLDSCNCLIDCFQDWLENVVSEVKTKDSVVVTNVLAARAVWDLEKYQSHPKFHTSCKRWSNVKNKWAPHIATCLASRLRLKTTLCVGYKEEGKATPMLLCVNQSPIALNLRKSFGFEGSLQNLGYAKL